MRNAATALTLLLLVSSADAATVSMKRPRIVYGTPGEVAASCRKPNLACTVLNAEFYCGCEQRQDHWALTPHVIATTSIYMTTDRFLNHELGHINDIHTLLNEYGASLLLRSFPSEGACQAFIEDESKAFSHTMKAIQHSTAIRRDGVQVAGPAE